MTKIEKKNIRTKNKYYVLRVLCCTKIITKYILSIFILDKV